ADPNLCPIAAAHAEGDGYAVTPLVGSRDITGSVPDVVPVDLNRKVGFAIDGLDDRAGQAVRQRYLRCVPRRTRGITIGDMGQDLIGEIGTAVAEKIRG